MKSILHKRTSFLITIILLSSFGAIIQILSYNDYINMFSIKYMASDNISKVIVAFFISWLIFITIQFKKMDQILKYKWLWLMLSLVLTLTTILFGFVTNGVNRWIILGPLGIYSGYWIFCFYCIYLSSRGSMIKNKEKSDISQKTKMVNLLELIIVLTMLILIVLYIEKQISLVMLFISLIYLILNNKKKLFYIATAIIIVTLTLFFYSNSNIVNRISRFYNYNDSNSSNYQTIQCINSISYGGLYGIGLKTTNRSIDKGNILPDVRGNTTFAIVIEHFGIIGGTLTILLFSYFVYYGLKIYNNKKKESHSISALTLFLLFGIMIFNFAHILNCLGIFPFSSNLSFFSALRDYNIVSMILTGFIFKLGKIKSEN